MFLRYVCIAVLFLLALPAAVRAQFTFTTNQITGALIITGYTGPGGTVTIPNYYTNNAPLNVIGNSAFANCTNLTAIALSSSITSIGALAFSNCINLKAAYFSSNAPPDVGNAFYGDTNAVVYYQSGTTNWGPMFGGAPTMAETPLSDFESLNNGGYSIIEGYAGTNSAVVIPASDNFGPDNLGQDYCGQFEADTLADSPAPRIWNELIGLLPRDKSRGYISAAPYGAFDQACCASHELRKHGVPTLPAVLLRTARRESIRY